VRWRARTIVQLHCALRASRPQLKRDPLGRATMEIGVSRALACATLACGALLVIRPASTNTQEPASVPTDLAYVVTGGWWQHGQESGRYRVLVFSPGFEHVISQVFIQWVRDPQGPDHPGQVIATAPIGPINDQPTWAVRLPELVTPNKNFATVTLHMANSHSDQDERRTCIVRVTLPGRLNSTCSPP
jgi:hypothetical protein